jgi:hypothetical protein
MATPSLTFRRPRCHYSRVNPCFSMIDTVFKSHFRYMNKLLMFY